MTARHDLRRAAMIQIRAHMPDACERMIPALANGPYDDAHRLAARALDFDSRIMQPGVPITMATRSDGVSAALAAETWIRENSKDIQFMIVT